MSETLWVHPVAEIARIIDSKGVEHYVNKAGEAVQVFEDNDKKREDEPNVGRPTKTKLSKQGQIKTKIIDEQDRLIRQAINVLDLLPIVRLMEKKKPDDKDNDKDDKKGKNPVVADKAKDQPGDPKVVDKKEGPKKADGSSDDDKDPKKITGGKTDVDIHPTTDDKITDDSKETADGKKAASAENKKIGAKGNPVKEEVIDELNHDTLKSYIHKASADPQRRQGVHMAAYKRMKNIYKAEPATTKRGKETQDRQLKNQHARATSAPMRKPTHKEDFTPEQLAYFDSVMAEAYVDMSKKAVDAIINAKGKPHKVFTATDETRHGIGVDELKRHLGVGDSDHVHKKFMHNLHTAGVRTGWSHSAGKWICYHGPKI
ncbi:MAG: hypothetical protein ACXV2C_08255 [Candidatus Bathyarchaeia archaeon]